MIIYIFPSKKGEKKNTCFSSRHYPCNSLGNDSGGGGSSFHQGRGEWQSRAGRVITGSWTGGFTGDRQNRQEERPDQGKAQRLDGAWLTRGASGAVAPPSWDRGQGGGKRDGEAAEATTPGAPPTQPVLF